MTKQYCHYCEKDGKPKEECWIELTEMSKHMHQYHTQAIEENALLAIAAPHDRVLFLLQKSKVAQSYPAELLNLYYRYFPFKVGEAEYRIIYDSTTGKVQFPTFNCYEDAQLFMRNIGSVGRADRAVREEYPELNGNAQAQAKKNIQEAFSRDYYGKQHAEMPNTYVPDSQG